jgi:hypothetical protein
VSRIVDSPSGWRDEIRAHLASFGLSLGQLPEAELRRAVVTSGPWCSDAAAREMRRRESLER